jgi:spore germination protein KB
VFYGDYLRLTDFLFNIFPYYGWAVELLIPALLLVIAVILKKGGKFLRDD